MATSIDFAKIFGDMVKAAENSLKDKWPDIKDLATSSIRTLAQNIVDIEKMKAAGSITNEQARLMIGIQQDAFKIVLLSEEGLGLLAVEAALNAVLKVIRSAVNTALGFILI